MTEPPRRLVFGEVADLYDAARPTYPDALIDDLAIWAGEEPDGGRRALEVGAGTGKATRRLAARGVEVVAVEPSAEMAAVLRERTADSGRVEIVEADLEHADLGGRRFPLVFAAQSWHWVQQPAGYARARAALLEGGRLVVFWNRPAWPTSPLRTALDAVYERFAGDLADSFNRPSTDVEADVGWKGEIAPVDGFGEPEVRRYDWELSYSATEYASLVATYSETRLMADDRRAEFLDAIEIAIADHGGRLDLPMYVRVCVARAA